MSSHITGDLRVEQILAAIMQLAAGDLQTRVAPSERGDELDAIISGLNLLGEELHHSTVSRDYFERRTTEFVGVMMSYALMNFDQQAKVGEGTDSTAQLALALNMLGEELSASVEAERKAKDLLEQRVSERTAELEEKLKTIAAQSATILELSTPVTGIWEEILVLPLIGTIDTRRAQQVIENLLDEIVKKQAAVVIMDITGVPVVDTKVANHFLKSVDAARMLGAEVILTGVSPHNAQTLVKLGVNLGRITTKGSLQEGLKLAFEMTRNKVIREAD